MPLSRNPEIRKHQLVNRKQARRYLPLGVFVIASLVFLLPHNSNHHSRRKRESESEAPWQCPADVPLEKFATNILNNTKLPWNDRVDCCRSKGGCKLADQYYKTCKDTTWIKNGGISCVGEANAAGIQACKDKIIAQYGENSDDWAVNWCDTEDFPESMFTIEERSKGAVALYIIGLVYMFIALAIICDEYFVPALDVMCDEDHWNLSNDVAGATLMAAGGSAPELFTSIIGVFLAESNVGIGTIVGSAVFNILFVLGACAFVVGLGKNGRELELTWFPVARDCVFYILSLGVLIWGFLAGTKDQIEWYESTTMFSVYIAYVVFMVFNERVQVMIGAKKAAEPPQEEKAALKSWGGAMSKLKLQQNETQTAQAIANADLGKLVMGIVENNRAKKGKVGWLLKQKEKKDGQAPAEEANDGDEPRQFDFGQDALKKGGLGCFDLVYTVISFPIMIVLACTIPNQQIKSVQKMLGGKMYAVSFIMSIVWISAFSWLMVWWATRIGESFNIDAALMGLTILAAGTSVPDLMTSIVVSKQGHGDMAVSSSIGSNIFDVTVGLPFPWMLYNFFTGPKSVSSSGLVCSIGLLLGMLVALVLSIMAAGWKLNKLLGVMMLVLYCAFVGVTLLFEYGTLTCPV